MKQHTIPRCYLDSFTDPNCPKNQEPYLWVLDRKGNPPRKKSPKNILVKKDFYTIVLPYGDKDYCIETSLAQLENEFIVILRNKIVNFTPLDEEEIVKIALFLSALFLRTISQKDHWEETYNRVANLVEQMEKVHSLDPMESIRIRKFIPDSHKERLVENLLLVARIILLKKPFFLISNSEVCFITSDNPYLYIDPQFDNTSFFQPVPISESTNLLIPLTPKIAFFGLGSCDHKNQYMIAKPAWVKGCNHTIANNCDRYIFSSKENPDFLKQNDLVKIDEEFENLEGNIKKI